MEYSVYLRKIGSTRDGYAHMSRNVGSEIRENTALSFSPNIADTTTNLI
jgi:hypothetical protein